MQCTGAVPYDGALPLDNFNRVLERGEGYLEILTKQFPDGELTGQWGQWAQVCPG